MRIFLVACCERVGENLDKYKLKYDFVNGRIYTDTEKFVPCVSCGKNLSGVPVIECVINRRGNIQELQEAMEADDSIDPGFYQEFAPEYSKDLTGMTD